MIVQFDAFILRLAILLPGLQARCGVPTPSLLFGVSFFVFRFHLLCSAKRCTAKSFGSLRALKRMITILLRYLCTDFFNRNPRF